MRYCMCPNIYCTRMVCVYTLRDIFVSVIVIATTYSIVIHSLFDALWNSSYTLPGPWLAVTFFHACSVDREKTECWCSLCYFVFVDDLWFTMEHTTRVQLNIGLLFMMRRKAFPDTFTAAQKSAHRKKKPQSFALSQNEWIRVSACLQIAIGEAMCIDNLWIVISPDASPIKVRCLVERFIKLCLSMLSIFMHWSVYVLYCLLSRTAAPCKMHRFVAHFTLNYKTTYLMYICKLFFFLLFSRSFA